MSSDKKYDVAIIGGGLAGLALSIQLARQHHKVVVLEKEQYPFHKVCGEYISLESWDFLLGMGIDLEKLKVPVITKLQLSSSNSRLLEQSLPLGGFGISRYLLDHELVKSARIAGVDIQENTKVNNVEFANDEFIISAHETYRAKLVCGTFGKRSNLDIKWKRPFSMAAKTKLNNYIGVKYHVKVDFPPDTIALHNFKKGYCGLVKIEEDKYNLCYLTTADNLKRSGGDISVMEDTILSANLHLKALLGRISRVTDPITISQVSFEKKSQVENHVLMIGDAAGMITPLCGNGMSMALHASKIAAVQIHAFLDGKISREKMEKRYSFRWRKEFAARLRMGRRIQRLLSNQFLANLFIRVIKPFPSLVNSLIRRTHGRAF